MAVYNSPSEVHHEHYVDRDTGSSAGIWAVVAVLIILFALLFFGNRLFGTNNNAGNTGGSGTNTQQQTPNTNSGASGSINGEASGSINY